MNDLSRHLKEAIALNRKRMPLYAELSNGASLPFSKQLIFAERLLLTMAWYFDRIGNKYQRAGIPFLQAEFAEMNSVRKFSNSFPKEVNYQRPIVKINLTPLIRKLKISIKQKDFSGIARIAEEEISSMAQQKHVYCLLRHIIESLGRIARCAIYCRRSCEEKGIRAPIGTILLLLRFHLIVLNSCKRFDEKIAPLQEKGIPFLYQDLPEINQDVSAYYAISF